MVDEAGVTTQVVGFRPANCALSGLIVVPVLQVALHASTMLKLVVWICRRRHGNG